MTNLELVLLCLFLAATFIAIYLGMRLFSARIEISKMASQKDVETQFTETFNSIAYNALTKNSEQFLMLAKSSLEKENEIAQLGFSKTVEPLQKILADYKAELEKVEEKRTKAHHYLETELKKVVEVSSQLGKETSALKNALKKPHVRGRWGEVQLKNCVELAGMSEFSDVTFQDQHTNEEGRLIPDMTVRMPGGRIVIVDAKTPIDAFLSSLEAIDEEQKNAEILRHGKHVKEHIKKLSSKAYSEQLKASADFTVMFLPNESFLYAALEAEPDLVEFAVQKKILIATPPTFIGLLKVIRFGWNEEKLAENAQKISEAGTELHKRVCDFLESYESVGKFLDRAKDEFATGSTRLKSRIIPQAKKLEALGAKSVKALPDSMLDGEQA